MHMEMSYCFLAARGSILVNETQTEGPSEYGMTKKGQAMCVQYS